MNKEMILKKIKEKAKVDAKNRKDQRFLTVMGFLVGKGFLNANFPVMKLFNKRIQIDDAVWAGTNVEPRILEVLPAAVLRLERHFDLDIDKHQDLAVVVDQLRKRCEMGADYRGIPYEKLKVWADFALKDGRVKKASEKRITKTFRFSPRTNDLLKKAAAKQKCTETELIERLLSRA